MLNLIRRDVILQKRQIMFFLPFIAFFIFTDAHPVLVFLMASVFIPFNAFFYDEKAETNILLNSLPYTRRQIIASRYVGAIFYMTVAISISSAGLFVTNKQFGLVDIGMGGGLFLVFAALTFPLFYIFKSGHISMVVMITFILSVGFLPHIIVFLGKHLPMIADFIFGLAVPVLYTGTAAVIIVLYGLSWTIADSIYQRKIF